jgi:hypothetical protein
MIVKTNVDKQIGAHIVVFYYQFHQVISKSKDWKAN